STNPHVDLRDPHSFPTRRSSDLKSDHKDPDKGYHSSLFITIGIKYKNCHKIRQPQFDTGNPCKYRKKRFYISEYNGNGREKAHIDRKSTRLTSSHVSISYAVSCS